MEASQAGLAAILATLVAILNGVAILDSAILNESTQECARQTDVCLKVAGDTVDSMNVKTVD